MKKFSQVLALVFTLALGYGAGQQASRLWATDYPTGGGSGIQADSTDTLTNKTIDATATGNVITNIGISELEAFGAKGDVIGFADGTAATGTVEVTAGTNSAGVNKVSGITVNSVEVMNAAEDWVTSHTQTAANIATSINTKISVPDYTAANSGAVVTITAIKFGTTPNTFVVAATVAGDVTTTDVDMASGADGAAKLITFRGSLLGNLDAGGEFVQRGTLDPAAIGSSDLASYTSSPDAVTFGTAFSSAPKVMYAGSTDDEHQVGIPGSVTTTGFNIQMMGRTASQNTDEALWVALGA